VADAVAKAESLKETHDIVAAHYQQRAIREFNGRRPKNELRSSARFRVNRESRS
jgi:hypothetical protein